MLHLVCNTSNTAKQCAQLGKLIKAGFPPSQIILCIYQITPTLDGIETVMSIIDYFAKESSLFEREVIFSKEHLTNRVRVSFESSIPNEILKQILSLIKNHPLTLEHCPKLCHSTLPKDMYVSCASFKDTEILGLNPLKVFDENPCENCVHGH